MWPFHTASWTSSEHGSIREIRLCTWWPTYSRASIWETHGEAKTFPRTYPRKSCSITIIAFYWLKISHSPNSKGLCNVLLNSRRCGLLGASFEDQVPLSALWRPLNPIPHTFKIRSLSESVKSSGLGSKSRTLTPKSGLVQRSPSGVAPWRRHLLI